MLVVVKVGRIVLTLMAVLILGDLIGVAACFIFDVMPFRGNSSLLPYAIWFVLGAFAGFLGYNFAGRWISPKSEKDWTNMADAMRTGSFVVAVSGLILLTLCGVFYAIWWRFPTEPSVLVPDSPVLSLLYFGTSFLAMVSARAFFMPTAK